MASAANQASLTRSPRTSTVTQRLRKIGQCRSPGSTTWQRDCASRSSQKPKASSIELGTLKIRPLVVMRTTALRTRGERPDCASLETSFTSKERQMACCGSRAEGADQHVDVGQDHSRPFNRLTLSRSSASCRLLKSVRSMPGNRPPVAALTRGIGRFGFVLRLSASTMRSPSAISAVRVRPSAAAWRFGPLEQLLGEPDGRSLTHMSRHVSEMSICQCITGEGAISRSSQRH